MAWDGPQYMIANALGIAAPRLTDWCMGRKEIPTRHVLALSRILKRNPEDLVGWADEDDYLIHPNEIVNTNPFYGVRRLPASRPMPSAAPSDRGKPTGLQ